MTTNEFAPDYVCRTIECEHYKENAGKNYCALSTCEHTPERIYDLLQIGTISDFGRSQLESLAKFADKVKRGLATS
ncbi:MAG: hypothetical protein KKB79_00335 [Nanoarchaeota archaeon]|nr:hypothetical protein [Nanoarchaeota archaeon]